ncbi:hypothetical protein CO641_08375 [Lysobacteraceae bacterium NML91-0213]|nr:hypothetical protein CO641_08375 [Xanthomonadaceae bacterium NML91-0213]
MTLKSHLGLPEHARPKADALAASLLDVARAGSGQLYAIVDLAAAEHASDWVTLLKREGTARNLFVSQPEAAAESLAAWLIPLGSGAECNEVLLGFSVAQALLSDSVSWLVSALPTSEMTHRLSRRLTARLDQGDALFRYYDPRLFPAIHKEWSGPETHHLFDLGSTWHYLDSSFDLKSLPLAPPGEADCFTPPLRVSAGQHRALQSISELHQLVRLLGLRKPDAFYRIDPANRLDFVSIQCSNAAGCGITRFIDLLRYCEFAMEHGEGFHQQTEWQVVWERMRSSEASLSTVVLESGIGEEA